MIIREALLQASQVLLSNGPDDAHLEAEVLLRHLLNTDRTNLYVNLDRVLLPDDLEAFWHLIDRRLHHEPAAYITGQQEFFGLGFYVDHRVLIPRPESELLVEKAIKLVNDYASHQPVIAEIGTGSGAIAISLARHLPQAMIYATDLSPAALEVAKINCQKHGVSDRVHLLPGDMLQPLTEKVDIIAANLPYVKTSELSRLSPEVRIFEPTSALDGGEDGLDKVRQLLSQAGEKLRPNGSILLEIAKGQGKVVSHLARYHFPAAKVELSPDLGGIDRVIEITI